jgi:aspartate/methionine/tyrosine aminotransferase
MTDLLDRANSALREASPALAACLSDLGQRALFPPGIPFQAAQAKGKTFNGTIGQITDGHGGAVPLPSLAEGLGGLSEDERTKALLYSPIDGRPELRDLWRERQLRDVGRDAGPNAPATTRPQVTAGLTHGLALLADLFAGPGRAVAVPEPFWGNYRQTFELRRGARMVGAPAVLRDGGGPRFDPEALAKALAGADLAPGEPAVAIANFPSNPGGYSPTEEERARLVRSLVGVASERPLLVIADDAYAGLVYDDAVPRRSIFWDLVDQHPNLVPVKVDGATKELSFFGGRVGFLTFAFDPESPAAEVLESKLKCLVRAGMGSPVAASQVVVARALAHPDVDDEIEAVRQLLGRRHRVLSEALDGCDPELLVPLPSNSGCFALVELGPRALAAGVAPEAVRRHLLEHEDTGLVSIPPRSLRIAYCSVDEDALPELVRRLERGVGQLSG